MHHNFLFKDRLFARANRMVRTTRFSSIRWIEFVAFDEKLVVTQLRLTSEDLEDQLIVYNFIELCQHGLNLFEA